MLEDSDIVKITVNQTYLGEDALNVFWYIYGLAVTGATLVDAIAEFIDDVWNLVRLSQHSAVNTATIKVENMTNGIDVDVIDVDTDGLDVTGGLGMPSYAAAGYSLDVSDKTTRPGSKRIVGMGEDRVNLNAYDSGGTVSADIADAFASFVDVVGVLAGEGTLIPIIVGRDEFGAIELTRTSAITSSSVSPTIRSQVSRRE